MSRGRAAFVSATAVAAADEEDSVKGGAGANAGGASLCEVSLQVPSGSSEDSSGEK